MVTTMEHNNNNTNKTIYKQLSNSVRIKIAKLHNEGYKIREIARRVSRDASTISSEIKRNGTMNQPSVAAQRTGTKPHRYTQKKTENT